MLAVGAMLPAAGFVVFLYFLPEALQVGGEGGDKLLVVGLAGRAEVVLELADAAGDEFYEVAGGEDAAFFLSFGRLASRRPPTLFKHDCCDNYKYNGVAASLS